MDEEVINCIEVPEVLSKSAVRREIMEIGRNILPFYRLICKIFQSHFEAFFNDHLTRLQTTIFAVLELSKISSYFHYFTPYCAFTQYLRYFNAINNLLVHFHKILLVFSTQHIFGHHYSLSTSFFNNNPYFVQMLSCFTALLPD
jgi:hypothetical protein